MDIKPFSLCVYSLCSDKPIRIRGIIEDYAPWSTDEIVSKMFKGTTFEISSVFVDYDDENRITFTLRNGTQIKQPRSDDNNAVVDELSDSDSDEVRIWNIVKAHWQCQVSMWPAMVHTWTHYQFSDLVCFSEQKRDQIRLVN